ncbi:hypothetical protein B0H16DRAFT_1552037 [Mycena metata]|uniref:Uncharacterized protein n=1 Tax=Mycena metata TaxID=1033252 RepID=A0AAD7IT76_9AGAR|nr:hypothetical protein B0H16DRAFT_1552037 [Mycena metata]
MPIQSCQIPFQQLQTGGVPGAKGPRCRGNIYPLLHPSAQARLVSFATLLSGASISLRRAEIQLCSATGNATRGTHKCPLRFCTSVFRKRQVQRAFFLTNGCPLKGVVRALGTISLAKMDLWRFESSGSHGVKRPIVLKLRCHQFSEPLKRDHVELFLLIPTTTTILSGCGNAGLTSVLPLSKAPSLLELSPLSPDHDCTSSRWWCRFATTIVLKFLPPPLSYIALRVLLSEASSISPPTPAFHDSNYQMSQLPTDDGSSILPQPITITPSPTSELTRLLLNATIRRSGAPATLDKISAELRGGSGRREAPATLDIPQKAKDDVLKAWVPQQLDGKFVWPPRPTTTGDLFIANPTSAQSPAATGSSLLVEFRTLVADILHSLAALSAEEERTLAPTSSTTFPLGKRSAPNAGKLLDILNGGRVVARATDVQDSSKLLHILNAKDDMVYDDEQSCATDLPPTTPTALSDNVLTGFCQQYHEFPDLADGAMPLDNLRHLVDGHTVYNALSTNVAWRSPSLLPADIDFYSEAHSMSRWDGSVDVIPHTIDHIAYSPSLDDGRLEWEVNLFAGHPDFAEEDPVLSRGAWVEANRNVSANDDHDGYDQLRNFVDHQKGPSETTCLIDQDLNMSRNFSGGFFFVDPDGHPHSKEQQGDYTWADWSEGTSGDIPVRLPMLEPSRFAPFEDESDDGCACYHLPQGLEEELELRDSEDSDAWSI